LCYNHQKTIEVTQVDEMLLTTKYLFNALRIPVSVYRNSTLELLVSEAPADYRPNLPLRLVREILGRSGSPHYGVSDNRILIGFVRDEEHDLLYLFGPALLFPYDRYSALLCMETLGEPMEKAELFVAYLDALPRVPESRFVQQLLLLYYMVHHCAPQGELIAGMIRQERGADDEAGEVPLTNSRHMELERKMLHLIRTGNTRELQSMFDHRLEFGADIHHSSKSVLRSAKNELIKSTALASRAAISGGMAYQPAVEAAESYIVRAEGMNSTWDVYNLLAEMMLFYASHTEAYLRLRSGSKLVHDVFNYVEAKLYARLRTDEMAEALGYSRSYLSRQFKQETGMTLVDFINKTKMEEAKLLLTTGRSIVNISHELGFSSQSYFQTVFKRVVGKTPSEYRSSGEP